jgi:beta-xylosidase
LNRLRNILTLNPVFLGLAVFYVFSFVVAGSHSSKAISPITDNGDGTYTNPIIHADYSDPDVIRVGDDFYLTASSFNSAPGLPILHSKDLVNWRIIGHAFQQQIPRDVFSKPQHGNGVWAPSIRFHNGEFYIYYGDPDFGIYMVKARNPRGPWSTPLLVRQAKGWIDPGPFWDDDGNAYLVHAWANSRAGIKSILTINRMNAEGTRVLDEGRMVFDGHQHHPTIEGPKLYKRNGYYYIFAPAGGVPTGWQTVLRSKNIYGPYEDRIVMDQGRTAVNGPHQGGWVELKSGESWFAHFQDKGAYGRIVHLQPLKWINDWPVIGSDPDGDGKGEPVMTFRKPDVGKTYSLTVPQTSDEFDAQTVGLQWQWQANYDQRWVQLNARKGWMRLYAVPKPAGVANLWSVPNLLLQKFPAEEFTVDTRVDPRKIQVGAKAGIVVMGLDYSYLAVERTAGGWRLLKVSCKNADTGASESEEASAMFEGNQIDLKVTVSKGAVCTFSYSKDGVTFTAIGEPFVARPGRWIGARVGLFFLSDSPAAGSYADFDWFRFRSVKVVL